MNSRDKGKRGEREAAKALADTFGCEAKRGVQFQGGKESPDVQHSIDGLHFEVKRCQRMQMEDWMAQAVGDAGDNVPLVLHRKNNKEWMLTVRLEDAREFATTLAAFLAAVPQKVDK